MPTVIDISGFSNFWKDRTPDASEKVLDIFTMGLGGPFMSNELFNFLEAKCTNYDKIYVFAFGSSKPGEFTTESALSEIENIEACKDRIKCYYYPDNLPVIQEIGSDTKETIKSSFETQFDGVTYEYYKTHPMIFYDSSGDALVGDAAQASRQAIVTIMRHFMEFFKHVKTGDILIDNNAFVRSGGHTIGRGAGYYSNYNFEYMYWLPKLLTMYKDSGRVFFLKRQPGGDISIPVPFFSPEAVTKWDHVRLYKMLVFTVNFPTDEYRDSVFAATSAAPDEERKRQMLLLVYKCLRDGSTVVPNFITNTCAVASGAAAAAAAITTGGRRRTRKNRKQKASRRRRVRK